MTNKVELKIFIDEQFLELFKQLCHKENMSQAQALCDYMISCIKAKRIIRPEDLEESLDHLEQIIDRRIAAALEKFESTLDRPNVVAATETETPKNEVVSWNGTNKSAPKQEIKSKVLIVEDSLTLRELLLFSLTKGGYDVEKARDGLEAWELLQSGLSCDLILCDIEMPRMDGLELLSKIQQDSKLSQIPVAVLTFLSEDSYKQTAIELGAKGYFIKPYTENELLDSVRRIIAGEVLLERNTNGYQKTPAPLNVMPSSISAPPKPAAVAPAAVAPAAPAPAPAPPPPPQKLDFTPKILIIDDSVIIREMVSMTFSNAGYKVEQARDGLEAWEKLKSGLHCDLILCDIEMPRMNGLEFLSRVQTHPEAASVPIAMLTSRGAQKMKRIAAQRGARAYFVKPYVDKILVDSAQRLLNGEVLLENANNN